jgi:hypothetical protein
MTIDNVQTYLRIIRTIPVNNVEVLALLRVYLYTTGLVDAISHCARRILRVVPLLSTPYSVRLREIVQCILILWRLCRSMVGGVSRLFVTDILLPHVRVLLLRILEVFVPCHETDDVAKGRVANEIKHDAHSRDRYAGQR